MSVVPFFIDSITIPNEFIVKYFRKWKLPKKEICRAFSLDPAYEKIMLIAAL